MDLDPLAIRNLLIWVALAVVSTILLGGVPSWIRCTARRADPSAAAAVFALLLALSYVVLLQFSGGIPRVLNLTPAAFWMLSVREWRAVTGVDLAPLRLDELAALMAAFPDRASGE